MPEMPRKVVVTLCLAGLAVPVRAQSTTDVNQAPVLQQRLVAQKRIALPLSVDFATERRTDAESPLRRQRSPNFARTRHSAGKGALIGFGIGAVLGMTVGQEACLNEPRWHCARVGISGAMIGAAVAWLHK
jgi:hypothetical protein